MLSLARTTRVTGVYRQRGRHHKDQLNVAVAARGTKVFRHEGIGKARLNDLRPVPDFTFGVELELFFPATVGADQRQQWTTQGPAAGWKVKTDNSIVCSPNHPSCYRVELVSPVLQGRDGLEKIYNVVDYMKPFNPSVNKSTGLHVHLRPNNSAGWTTDQLKKLAYNFVQLESAMDYLVPKSRRGNNNQYCKSNVMTITANRSISKKDALAAIKASSTTEQLKNLVCPTDRYYKLNLRALERHDTVEFRHGAGSANAAKVVAYVLLCLCLAQSSTSGKLAPMAQKGYVFENLVKFMAAYPVLVNWLPRRHLELNPKSTLRRGPEGATSATATSSSRRQGSHSSGCGCAACRGHVTLPGI